MMNGAAPERSLGLIGATAVGVGAIVGGGILALAGVAFATAGPAAILAFALNGVIAFLTALSFAEMSTAFAESGGTYNFAKKVLSVRSAFAVGWVVWFASIVAGVLYAISVGSYAVVALSQLWQELGGDPPAWVSGRPMVIGLAAAVTIFYTASLVRRSTGGGQWASFGKVVVFSVLIGGGLWALVGRPVSAFSAGLTPFFPAGGGGVLLAMGFTFIALQGFDLIAAVAGEIREPGRTIPRAMFLSLAIALCIYIPLLFIVATVGVGPGESIVTMSAEQPEVVVAVAARNYLGATGFWLVILAALLSMLSALYANLLAASRIARVMALDRTLPSRLGRSSERWGTPVAAILASCATLLTILLVIPDVASAGAAASLIFLITFALAHWTSILARRRSGGRRAPFQVPFFPLVPVIGLLACFSLALFQGISVPAAGLIAGAWLLVGAVFYLSLFARRARVFDASQEARDPRLVQLRGRSPLVLVPIANPANAEAMVSVANAIAPPGVGRVLLLSVVSSPREWEAGAPPAQLLNAQEVLGEALTASFSAGLRPEALTTVAPDPWREIGRVASTYRCESLLLGLSRLEGEHVEMPMEALMSGVACDIVVLRATKGWKLSETRRVLVPVGGRGGHEILRARLLGSLCRGVAREVAFLQVVREGASPYEREQARRMLERLASDEAPGYSSVNVEASEAIPAAITGHAAKSDLVILGLQRARRRQRVFGEAALRIARDTNCAIIMISGRG